MCVRNERRAGIFFGRESEDVGISGTVRQCCTQRTLDTGVMIFVSTAIL